MMILFFEFKINSNIELFFFEKIKIAIKNYSFEKTNLKRGKNSKN